MLRQTKKHRIKTLLIFPPLWNNFYPYLSLPVLKAYLNKKGYEVNQWDINALLNKEFVKKSFLEKCRNLIKEKLDNLPQGVNNKTYRELEKQFLLSEFVVNEITESLRIVKAPEDFYNPEKMSKAQSVINFVYKVITVAYPCFADLKGFEMIYSDGANYSFKKMIPLLDDPGKNFLVGYYNREIVPEILKQNPDVLGLSITSYSQLIPALTLAKQIKKINNLIHITVGGNAITRIEHMLRHNKNIFEVFDTAITHEGEVPLETLLCELENNKKFEEVPNLVYIKNGEVTSNPKYKFKSIESLPAPDFCGFNPDDYMGAEYSLPVYATRGCYWNRCTFCDHSLIYNDNYVQKSAQKIVSDIAYLSLSYNVNHFHFHDECISPVLCRKISEEIIRTRLEVKWYLNVRVEKQFTPELTSLMYKAGCRMVSIGIESFNNNTLKKMDKGSTSERIYEVVKSFSQAGILTHGFIIVGFPGETPAEANDTYNFIKDNSEILHLVGVSVFTLGVKSKIANDFTRFSISNLRSDVYHELDPGLRYNDSTGMSEEEVTSLKKNIKKILNTNENKHLYQLKSRMSVFLYACKNGSKCISLQSDTENTDVKQKSEIPTYRLNKGIYYGNKTKDGGMPIYDFLKKNKITTKDNLLCEIVRAFKYDDEYTCMQVLNNINSPEFNPNSITLKNKVKYYLEFLNKKEILIMN
jgi:anaerobic magnesium-protoporphyrin IX monomethyl ester cyclase